MKLYALISVIFPLFSCAYSMDIQKNTQKKRTIIVKRKLQKKQEPLAKRRGVKTPPKLLLDSIEERPFTAYIQKRVLSYKKAEKLDGSIKVTITHKQKNNNGIKKVATCNDPALLAHPYEIIKKSDQKSFEQEVQWVLKDLIPRQLYKQLKLENRKMMASDGTRKLIVDEQSETWQRLQFFMPKIKTKKKILFKRTTLY